MNNMELNARLSNILYKAGLVSYKCILETEECDLQNLGCFSGSELRQIYNFAGSHVAPKVSTGAAFLCTEDKFPSVRFNQLLKTFPAANKFSEIKFGNNVFVEHIADAAELLQCVEHRLPQLVKQQPIGLVVIDSVAAVYRADYSSADMIQRARDMRALAAHLHRLANTHNIAVVCVNQVSDVRRGETSETVPALGLAWANLVTCRLQMFRQNDSRHLKVIFAPHLPQGTCQYKITEEGVVGIS